MGAWHGGTPPRVQYLGRDPKAGQGWGGGHNATGCRGSSCFSQGLFFSQVGGEGRGRRTQRRPGGFRGTALKIHRLREDFLDYSPTPLPVDLDPAQGTVKSSAPLCVHAPPLFKANPQVQGQKGLGLPVLRRPRFLVPLS